MTTKKLQLTPASAVMVFVFFVLLTAFSSVGNYCEAEKDVQFELDEALMKTLATQNSHVITLDTIRNYRAQISSKRLREAAYLTYSLQGGIEARCSREAIWQASDQRAASVFGVLALFWAISSVFYFRWRTIKEVEDAQGYGGLFYDEAEQCFYNRQHERVKLTPMQFQLLTMFFATSTHQLSHSQITSALWPKKDDPSETLYTLIRRLKKTLEGCSRLKIESDRGRAYRLIDDATSI